MSNKVSFIVGGIVALLAVIFICFGNTIQYEWSGTAQGILICIFCLILFLVGGAITGFFGAIIKLFKKLFKK